MQVVSLVEFSPMHVHRTYEWLRDAELRNKVDCSSQPTTEGNEEYWARNMLDASRNDYAVIVDNEHVGNCGLNYIGRIRIISAIGKREVSW